MIAAGTYNEALNINKGVTLMGANAGIDGNDAGHRGAETIITGQSQITTAAKVVVDGVEYLDNQAYTFSIGDNFVALKVLASSTAGHVIENSVFMRDPVTDPAGYSSLRHLRRLDLQPTHRGLELASVTAGTTSRSRTTCSPAPTPPAPMPATAGEPASTPTAAQAPR